MCKICGNLTRKFIIKNMIYDYCDNCFYLSKNSANYLSEADEKARYLNHNNDTLDYYNYQSNFFDLIKDYLGKNILDFGCGKDQVLVNVINDHNLHAIGYDYYFSKINYDINNFDTVIMEEVIEHLKNPLETLKGLINRNNKSFKLIIKTELFNDISKINEWWYLRDSTHIGFFKYETFVKISDLLDLKILFFNKKNIIILALK